jgi:hypothetical protein
MSPDFFADLFHLPASEREDLIAVHRSLSQDLLIVLKLQYLRDKFYERRKNLEPIEILIAFLSLVSEGLYNAGIRSADGDGSLSVASAISIIHLIGWPLEAEAEEIDSEVFR